MSKSVRGAGAAPDAHLFDSNLDRVSNALDALTEIVRDAVFVQNMSIVPDPRSGPVIEDANPH